MYGYFLRRHPLFYELFAYDHSSFSAVHDETCDRGSPVFLQFRRQFFPLIV